MPKIGTRQLTPAHGHTTDQPDQEDHAEVAAPALVKGGPEVIPRDANRPSDQREASVGCRIPTSSASSRAIRTLLHDSWPGGIPNWRWSGCGADLVLAPPLRLLGCASRLRPGDLGAPGRP